MSEALAERGFVGALVHATSFPAFDAGSKDIGYLSVALLPRTILPPANPGTKLGLSLGGGPKQKPWQPSNFRLQIDGLDCTKVSRIEAFTVRRPIEVVTSGPTTSLSAGRVDFPDLRITLAPTSALSWSAWHADFVVAGHNGPAFERSGSISLLSANLQELARIDLAGLGIFRVTAPEPDPKQQNWITHVVADLYCEHMTLRPGGAP